MFSYFILMMDSQDIVATGGIDTNAVLFDRLSGQILCTLTGHSKKVLYRMLLNFTVSSTVFPKYLSKLIIMLYSITQITTLKFVPRDELFVTGSADKVISIYYGF